MKNRGLDLIDQKLLYELDLDSGQSFSELAQKVGIPKETAATRVKRLVKNGAIKHFLTTVHVSNLGAFYYKFFLKFQKTTPEIEKKILEYLKNNKAIAYLAGLEGRFDLTFLVLARGTSDLTRFLVPFKEQFGEYIFEQEILTMTSVHRFNFRFFHEGGKLQHIQYPEELQTPDLDALDYAVLTALAQDARANLTALAKANTVHPNVVRYRIQKLKSKEILGSAVLDIDFEKFGVEQYQVDFSLKNQSAVKKIIEFVSPLPEATFATVTLGKYDLALEFAVRNSEGLKRILDRIKSEFSATIISHDIFVMHEHSINWLPSALGK